MGCRGIPARHGGFETFAEYLALHLVARGWHVTVYCQNEAVRETKEEWWRGVRLVQLPAIFSGSLGSLIFDVRATLHAARERGLVLTLGYNTAILGAWFRLRGLTHLINMDGVEWRRSKWSLPVRAWFYLNERLGCWLADHLIADHEEIKVHLSSRVSADKITVIPYGADRVTASDPAVLERYHLRRRGYILVIARAEPENSVLQIVSAFSEFPRAVKLVVVGELQPQRNGYHRRVVEAANSGVVFLGGIYDRKVLNALRYDARIYCHGHRVGGTNPSLVEALGAGSAILAHDNRFNRWVAAEAAHYFTDRAQCAALLTGLLENEEELARMRQAGMERFRRCFTWNRILGAYDRLLDEWHREGR